MIRLWLFAALLAIPGISLAKAVPVQSGEHADFSRLVINFGSTPEWVFGRVEGGYELRPARPGLAYNVDRVFEMIPKDRITALESRPDGALFLAVACYCHADVFEHRGQVVVDIRDGPAQNPEKFDAYLMDALDPADPVKVTGANVGDLEPETASIVAAPFRQPSPYRPQGTALEWNGTSLSPPLAQRPPFRAKGAEVTVQPSDPRVAEVQAALVAQIARAAAEGLVTPGQPITEGAGRPEQVAETMLDASRIDGPSQPTPVSGSNVRIETAFERGELPASPTDTRNDNGDRCLPAERFDLAAWGKPPDQGAAIADYRAGLVREFDAADPQSLATLARHYIYLTFGAEAQSLIGSFEGQVEDAEVLTMLAEIMDDGQSDAFPAIAAQISCDSASALWAILANPRMTTAQTVSTSAVLTAFSAMPLHLRRHLGPGLADRFLQIGDTPTAAIIRNSLTRAPGTRSAGVSMMEAGIALELGDREGGVSHLAEVVETNGRLAPEAVVTLIETRLDDGKLPDSKLIETAAALAFEARTTDIGARLTVARLRAVAHQGKIVEALDELDASIEPYGLTPDAVLDVRREAMELASKDDSDAQLLRVALRGPLRLGDDPDAADTRRRITDRLIDLGLYPEARGILGEIQGVLDREDRLLYAKSFLAEERPDMAIGYLAGLKDDAARLLLAQAHLQAQEFERAGALFADIGQTEASARAAWRGRNLEKVREIGTQAERDAASLTLDETDVTQDAGDRPVTLAQSERVLQQSRETRQVFAALLDQIGQP